LLVLGFAVLIPKPPDTDSSAARFAVYYLNHQDAIRAGLTVVGIGFLFYFWFLGILRGVLAAAEGGGGSLASVAFGGGVAAGVLLIVGVAAGETAAFRPNEVDPQITRAFSDFFVVIGAPAAGPIAVFFAATALAGSRYRALPGWAVTLSWIGAVGALPAIGTALTTTGAFSGDGILGLFVPVITFVVGLVGIAVGMIRNPIPAAAATQ
jgi:hypothetical protein